MISEASWQTGGSGRHGEVSSAESPMDQQSVESLLRRLVARVEESERRYSSALDNLHARLDQLSQTTGAPRAGGTPEDAETFDRLHDQVSSRARRLEGEGSTPLDDFERLGRALAGDLDYAASLTGSPYTSQPLGGNAPFAPSLPATDYPAPLTPAFPSQDNLDQRLVEIANRLEQSIGAAMRPQTIDALHVRLDEIGNQVAKALEESPKGQSFEPLERQICDMAQQLGRAEAQLAKIGEIEGALHRMIERVDRSPAQLEEIATKAASEAARLVAHEVKLSAGATERLEAMHRDLVAMNDRTRASDERLAGNIETVHESLKQLVQQIERNAAPAALPAQPPAALPVAPRPRVPFAERMRHLAPTPDKPAEQNSSELPGEAEKALTTAATPGSAGSVAKDAPPKDAALKSAFTKDIPPKDAASKDASPKNRLAAAIADLEDSEAVPHFGRAKRGQPDDKAFDLDSSTRRSVAKKMAEAEYEAPNDLVAAARRAARAAALKAEERKSGIRVAPASADSDNSSIAGLPTRRKRSFLIISAAILLATSAMLLYGRLRSKPEGEMIPPAAEQSAPMPSDPSQGAAPGAGESTPAAVEPKLETPSVPDSSELQPEASPAESSLGAAGQGGNFTDVAKSSYRDAAASDSQPQPQPVSLKPTEQPILPPGVVFSIEDPALGTQTAAATPMRTSLPLPPPDAMHNLAVSWSGRQTGTPDYALAAKWYGEAAAYGLADSQFNLGILAEHGLGMPKNLPEAYKWFSLAAKGGDQEAAHRRQLIEVQLTPADLAAAQQTLAAWAPKVPAAEANAVEELPEWVEASATPNTALVTRAQGLLNKLGYDLGVPDGLMGAPTREAILSFERKNGLEETGKVTVPLVAKLERLTS